MTTTPSLVDERVCDAAKAFAQVLADTPEFRAFDEHFHAFKHDASAQAAVRQFEEAQRSLQIAQRLGALAPSEQEELTRLRAAMLNHLSVRAYVAAQDELMALCQAIVKEMSDGIGLDFASACAPSCCG